MKPAAFPRVPQRPRHWEKRVLAAYFRMLGSEQAAAGAAVGRSARTIRDWEADHQTWDEAREDARQRWLRDVTDAARVALLGAIKNGNGALALQLLERVDADLAPAKHRHDVNLDGGGLAALLTLACEEGHADTQP